MRTVTEQARSSLLPDVDQPRIRSAVFGTLLYIDGGESLDSALDLMRDSVQLTKPEAEQVRALVVLHLSVEGSQDATV